MSTSDTTPSITDGESIHKEYLLDIRIIETSRPDGEGRQYRFEAPQHTEVVFDDPDMAELYTDVYFDVNGFAEEGTGDRGIPPEIVQAGKDTLAAYMLTMPGTTVDWVASFYGRTPAKIEQYVSWVQERAAEIRERAAKTDLA